MNVNVNVLYPRPSPNMASATASPNSATGPAAPHADGDTPACNLTCLPDMAHGWPFADGKGCFGKDSQGKELHFLKRLFLLLAFPNLELPGQSGRTLCDAIRWKRADQLEALGLPASTAAFEIVDVRLVEVAVYPQYASGSFNKTCKNYGMYSPLSSRPSRSAKGAPSSRLSRKCICVSLANSNLCQLEDTATAADVYRHAALVVPRPASATRPTVAGSGAPRSGFNALPPLKGILKKNPKYSRA